MRNLLTFLKHTLLIAVLSFQAGCIPVTTKTSNVSNVVGDLKLEVTPGVTTRSAIHGRFQEPIIRNDSLRIEVYRALMDSYGTLTFVFYLPTLYEKEDEIVYVLLQYDEKDIVSEVDWTVYSERNKERSKATAKVKNLEFFALSDEWFAFSVHAYEFITLDIASSNEAMNDLPPDGKCIVTIYPNRYKKIKIDNEVLYDLPNSLLWARGILGGVVQKHLRPGDHVIYAYLSRETNQQKAFSCKNGEQKYIQLNIDVSERKEKSFWKGNYVVEKSADVYNEPPKLFMDQRKILYHIDRWFD